MATAVPSITKFHSDALLRMSKLDLKVASVATSRMIKRELIVTGEGNRGLSSHT